LCGDITKHHCTCNIVATRQYILKSNKKIGEVEHTVIKTRKSRCKGSAFVVMGSKEATVSLDSILLFLYYFALYYYFPFDF
jgi:hypothetical protein